LLPTGGGRTRLHCGKDKRQRYLFDSGPGQWKGKTRWKQPKKESKVSPARPFIWESDVVKEIEKADQKKTTRRLGKEAFPFGRLDSGGADERTEKSKVRKREGDAHKKRRRKRRKEYIDYEAETKKENDGLGSLPLSAPGTSPSDFGNSQLSESKAAQTKRRGNWAGGESHARVNATV